MKTANREKAVPSNWVFEPLGKSEYAVAPFAG
jgi:hypothetical protein